MDTPTIQEIKTQSATKSPYFFNRDTLRFFGQTMKSFKIVKSPSERVFIYAPSWDTNYAQAQYIKYAPDTPTDRRGKFMHFTLREFKNGNLISPSDFTRKYYNDYEKALKEILDYIAAN